jgi:glycosyltransferase involved in cell wall biosynthesis
MKIAFLNDVAYQYAVGDSRAVGGTERDIWLLSRALAGAGWSVAVGVRDGIKARERTVIEGVEYVGIGHGHTLQMLLECHRFLSSERPHWLFWEGASHWWGPCVEVAKLAGVRTVFHSAYDTDVQPRRALFRRRRWWPLYAWGLSRTDRIFVQHTGQLLMLSPGWRSKTYILPKVCPLPTAVKPHSERPKYVAWVAMLRQHKRPDLLIEVARKAHALRFVVCGGPTNFDSPPGYGMRIVEGLRRLPNVEFLGQVAPEKAQQVIADAAVLLSTSDGEGFPNTFVQAWSSGTPVVTLKIDPDRIIEKLGLGMVSGSVEVALADINALMDSPTRREEIAFRARRYVSENHNEAAVVRAFNNALCDAPA